MQPQKIAQLRIWTSAPGSQPPLLGRDLVVIEGPLDEAEWDMVRVFAHRLDREDIRLRFGYLLDLHDEPPLRRAFEIGRSPGEMIWKLDETGAIAGLAHQVALSQSDAEFALIVRSDLKRRGIGEALLRSVLARSEGVRTLRASVLWENRAMLRLAAKVGYLAGRPSPGSVELTFAPGGISDRPAKCP